MPSVQKISKADARRALVRHHFAPSPDVMGVFERLRSVQFDPIAPVGCNHDLVFQARVRDYRIGDWQESAYRDRLVYDGWDKMASLVPFSGWPIRRHIYDVHRRAFEKKIFEEQRHAVDAVLNEIASKGPLMPKEFDFQERKDEWQGSWFGPSVTKQVLRALWHSGEIMTAGRQKGQHVYDLTERVVPSNYYATPRAAAHEAVRELVLERHRAMGIVRPAAPPEIWSNEVLVYKKKQAISELVDRGDLVSIDIEGMVAHATPTFLEQLDRSTLDDRVVFVAPLDPFIWDRKMTARLFGFEYVWEIYVPEAKRKWGYYVLPVLCGDQFIARAEFWARGSTLEIRQWHWEPQAKSPATLAAVDHALRAFMRYSSSNSVRFADHIDPETREALEAGVSISSI